MTATAHDTRLPASACAMLTGWQQPPASPPATRPRRRRHLIRTLILTGYARS
ncbi:MAG: hypothetical protein QOI17_1457 [Gaiellales bacterium]|jgi:hypothetical protein|nr:hypothetical protein [Gaiellales bacterium]